MLCSTFALAMTGRVKMLKGCLFLTKSVSVSHLSLLVITYCLHAHGYCFPLHRKHGIIGITSCRFVEWRRHQNEMQMLTNQVVPFVEQQTAANQLLHCRYIVVTSVCSSTSLNQFFFFLLTARPQQLVSG